MSTENKHLQECKEECLYSIKDVCAYGGWNRHGKCFLEWEKEQEKKTAEMKKSKPKRNKVDFQEIYDGWWVGKKCRLSTGEVKEIESVKLVGPPSFVYGCAFLHFTDGTESSVNSGGSFRPRKKDVIIVE